jgi:hypothetical protein
MTRVVLVVSAFRDYPQSSHTVKITISGAVHIASLKYHLATRTLLFPAEQSIRVLEVVGEFENVIEYCTIVGQYRG